jgi:hypothetical protein
MMDGEVSADGQSNSDTPWQPLMRIMSRQTVQRMDFCRYNVTALRELEEK